MADFNEQLQIISSLREDYHRSEEALYQSRLELKRIAQSVHRAEQKPTVVDAERDRQVASLHSHIAQLEARLMTLRENARQIAQWFAQMEAQRQIVEHLQQNLTSIENRIEALHEQLAALRDQNPPPVEKIEKLETELHKLEQLQADLSESLRKAEEEAARFHQQAGTQRQIEEGLQSQIQALREELDRTHARLAEQLQPIFEDSEALKGQQKQLQEAERALRDRWLESDLHLRDAIKGLYQNTQHPREILRQFNDRIPFLLFPVRLETIFVPSGRQTELWVRVYPDEIAVHTHEKVLTDREVLAGELYWTELVTAEHLREEKDVRRRSAWSHLVELFGGQRASWLVRQTKPADWDALVASGAVMILLDFLRGLDDEFFDELAALPLAESSRAALQSILDQNDSDAFSRLAQDEDWFDRINEVVRKVITGFPVHDMTRIDSWTRAPRTKIMPDKFVLLLYASETAPPREIIGNTIPDTLFLGPDPFDAHDSFPKDDDPRKPRTYGDSFNWMSDFDKAVEQGMGFRIPLTATEARDGFTKILVLGTLLSVDANMGAVLMEELIDNHQFSRKGFSLVPQGTPTNNTERNGTGYSDNDPYDDLAFFTPLDQPAFDPANPDPKKSQTDGRRLADALGISYTPLQTVQHADQPDIMEAYALSTVLFPSTLGYWLKNWMAPVIKEEIARQTRSFFTPYVSGRGPLPAVRVGNQPYGILLTSDFSRWKYPESGELFELDHARNQARYLRKLHGLLLNLDTIWSAIARNLPFIGKPGGDSSETLMNILGLHPTSVEFFQRIGYSSEYLDNLNSFKDKGRYKKELNSFLLFMPFQTQVYLKKLGIEEAPDTLAAMKSLRVLWQHYVTALDVPNLVENKPPSETNTLSFNYIEWLASAETTEVIINQDFKAPPPSALLYLMLRNALLLQLNHGSYEWLKDKADFDDALQKSLIKTTLVGIRNSAPALSAFELMSVPVEAAEPSHPTPGMSVANWLWNGPQPTEVEAAFLREQRAALQLLTQTPTARLERCLVEHLDCCNYRLDAWQTGLFTHRLQMQRLSGGQPDQRQTGIYIGAFGWVENLKPSTKVFVNPQTLPPLLQPNDNHPVLEEDDVIAPSGNQPLGSKQGGFVHTPSLNHASAAALLRNAYLSHASPTQAEMFSVNLSSERVRRAQFILEGMRNGQPVEAILGYQFERRLHDLTSASAARGDVPVLEFNQFIQPYREAFPFEAKEVVQAGTGAAAEAIPAYNVVNGLRLMQATLNAANGYGLSEVLPLAQRPDAVRGAAILAEQDGLLDSFDAVKDLLMAENAFQLVRGNFDRVAAVSLAQKEAHIPPELEVINTPRGSEFTFTNRVTLHFDDLDPDVPESNPWAAIPLTPRGYAEPGMNSWLGSLLGANPHQIYCDAKWVDTDADGVEVSHDRHLMSLADLRLQPVDFVWMVSSSPEDTHGATELETRIAYHYRRNHNVGNDKTVLIGFNPSVEAGEMTFARLFPLARHLRALISKSRALNAKDFLPAAGGKASTIPIDKKNPEGYDAAELRGRVQSGLNALTALAEVLDGASSPAIQLTFINQPDDPADDEIFTGTLGAAFSRLETAKLTFTDTKQLSISFLLADAEILHQKLRAISDYGISDAFPPEADLTTDSAKSQLLARAHRVARLLRRSTSDGVLDRAADLLNGATTDKSLGQQVTMLLAAGKILSGENFDWLPRFNCYNEIDLATADADRGQLLTYAATQHSITQAEVVEEWVQGLARVRPQLHLWELVRTLADALQDAIIDLRPVQVPYRTQDSWLAVQFPEKDPNDPTQTRPFGISRDTLSIAAHGKAAFKPGIHQYGVLLDEWTEEIPTTSEITGISFRFNQPNAMPPQTLLLVVTPEETGSWDWDDLVGTLTDTLHRAKLRAVEPEQLEKQGMVWNALAPALVSEFSTQMKSDISLDLMGVLELQQLTDFYSVITKTP